MNQLVRQTENGLGALLRENVDWVTLASRAAAVLRRAIPFDRTCWHTVDPGTVLFTGSLNQNISCSGTWLAEYEYVIEDVNKWQFLARSGRLAGATSAATHGDLSRSARHRSHEAYGIGDELRGAFVADGVYWGAVGLLRDQDQPWFTEQDVRLLASVCAVLGEGIRRALLVSMVQAPAAETDDDTPGVVTFDKNGQVESISPAAERWIAEFIEVPPPSQPSESKIVHAVAARARALRPGDDPLHVVARSRVQTRSGRWLLLYGTPLSGGARDRVAVIIQSAAPREVAPLVALAYGLTERECQVTALCIKGLATKEIAQALSVSPHTVRDHLKSIFEKTGVRSRGELVGRVFLEHYAPRWEEFAGSPAGWSLKALPARI